MLLSVFDTIGTSTLIMANIMPTAPRLAASSSSSSTASSRSSRSTQTMYNGLNGAAAPDPTESIDMDVVPPYHPSKTLVLCFDGTGDQFDTDVCLCCRYLRDC
ncbi:uncharacterized protein LAESUDRAFT_723754 [Laetiporus sulphureus 93-53]|uniref:DUF2235 domain-containing protein n=1 Tax=Laetiporus sulphureus 93-53 TaxID=1314785 RepID=A0A165FDM1_9APHY|nr:uncharacterized protein LAESUDRAFT_723754 [Laetiporus sulphureus 93-53]KZT08808.1 hypothetical protein LAESUDRAFT_723754 [Laetiporus sulphureus 93-53]